jgi:predicted MPP superfamily phosphohydrolase
MRFFTMANLVLLLFVFISWLNYRLLARLFLFCRTWKVKLAYLALTATTVLVLVLGLRYRPPLSVFEDGTYAYFVYAALAWLVGQLCLIVVQPLLFAANRLLPKKAADGAGAGQTAPGITRRVFLHRALAAVPLVALGTGAQGVFGAQTGLAVVRHAIAVPGLPAGLEGFRIGQVSDTHVGPYFDLARLDAVLTRLAAEKPDLVAVTGDFIDDLTMLGPAVDRLAALRAAVPHGVYFCMGNHEYFRDPERIQAELRRKGIRILTDENALIVPGSRPLYVLGVDYPAAVVGRRSFNVSEDRRKKCFRDAGRGVPPEAVRVLIAHHPDFLYDGFAAKVPLTLAGHTHGGQVVIAGRPLAAFADYVRGMFRENGVYGYVSSGAGHWLPFRLGCPPEISVFTLKTP